MVTGRKLSLIIWDPKLTKELYDFNKNMVLMPVLIKKGAFKEFGRDMWGRFALGQFHGHVSMPDEVLQEIIRVRIKYKNDLAKYHSMLNLLAITPYQIGTPNGYVYQEMEKNTKIIGLFIPKEE